MITEKQILKELGNYGGYFTIDEVINHYEGISGAYNDDYTFIVRWLFDLEDEGKLYRIRHNKFDYYITPDNFQNLIRLRNIDKLLG